MAVSVEGSSKNKLIISGLLFMVLIISMTSVINKIASYSETVNQISKRLVVTANTSAVDDDDNTTSVTILLFGRTKAGKSSLGNRIIGNETFDVGNDLESFTSSTRAAMAQLYGKNGLPMRIKIIDTPGFADNRADRTNEDTLRDILTFISRLKNGLDIGIYCIPAEAGISKHDIEELDTIGMLLGHNVFKHTLIAVTKGNILENQTRTKVYNKYPKELPEILQNNGIFDFDPSKVLFADFDSFEETFVPSLTKFVAESSNYQPEISKDLNITDAESIKAFIASPEIQQLIQKNEEKLEKQRKMAEDNQKLMEERAQKLQADLEENQRRQESILKDLENANDGLRESNGLNQELQKQILSQKSDLQQLEERSLVDKAQLDTVTKRMHAKSDEATLLKAQIEDLEKSKISREKYFFYQTLGVVIIIGSSIAVGIVIYHVSKISKSWAFVIAHTVFVIFVIGIIIYWEFGSWIQYFVRKY